MRRLVALAALLCAALLSPAADPPPHAAGTSEGGSGVACGADQKGLTFEVKLDAKLVGGKPQSGRVVLAIAKGKGRPNFTNTDPPANPVLGVDATDFTADKVVTLNAASDIFPLVKLNDLSAGEYTVQAIFATNRDINLPNAPGNRFSTPTLVKLDPAAGTKVTITLDKTYEERRPKDSATHKYLHVPSKLLSDFHGREMVYRVGVVLPPNFDADADKKYALLVHIGGFGSRYTNVGRMSPDPRFVQILLDGAGPFGDPYHVDSANNGPYGEALTTEVIPHVEKAFRCVGTGKARFTTGGSTGGWVSFALQVLYPDYFNGCWSQCPDSVTFERFELMNIYRDDNAYVNRHGFDRPSKRTLDGDVVFTVRHENQLENVLGRGGRWELSGRGWASWNATYGPKGKDGLPVPLWDGKTGKIDKAVLDHWKKYDLKLILEQNWKTLGPKLAGKVNIWVGDADDYFLNNAVHLLKASLDKQTEPKFDGRVLIEMRRGHSSGGWTQKQMLDDMAARAGVK